MKLKFISNPYAFFLSGCAFGLAIGFAKFFDRWVYFPFFPNILDSAVMIVIAGYLGLIAFKSSKDK